MLYDLDMRDNINDSQLQGMAREHISYEIEMFISTAKLLYEQRSGLVESNALLESFLIHARCLLDFLYPENLRKDDTIADDFFTDPTNFRSELPSSLLIGEFLRKRTGKEVAHLTYGRLGISSSQKQWKYMEIHSQLSKCLSIFFKYLSEDQRNWFSTIVK